jgi:hypothetical protein
MMQLTNIWKYIKNIIQNKKVRYRGYFIQLYIFYIIKRIEVSKKHPYKGIIGDKYFSADSRYDTIEIKKFTKREHKKNKVHHIFWTVKN